MRYNAHKGALLVAFAAISLIINSTAMAREIRIQNFQTAHNTTYIGLEDALLTDQPFGSTSPGRIYFYGDYSLVREPWIDLDDRGSVYEGTLIKQAQVINLGLGWLWKSDLQFGFELPVEQLTTENSSSVNTALNGSSTTGLGDARAYAKWQLFKTENNFAMALMPSLFLPTGFHTTNGYRATATSAEKTGIGASWGTVGAALHVILEKQFKSFIMSFDAGVDYHSDSFLDGHTSISSSTPEYTKVDMRLVYPVSLGFFIPLTERFGMNLEASSKMTAKHNEYTQPGEAYVGLRYQINPWTSAHVGYGGSAGLKNGTGERYVAGIKIPLWMGEKPASEPVSPPAVIVPEPAPTVRYTQTKIEIDETIEFDTAKATLTDEGKKIVDRVADLLLAHQDEFEKVTVEGHTDHIGAAALNQKLSEKRAQTVKEHLISKGLAAKKISSVGFGKTKPLFNGSSLTSEQMRKNRRVEFIIKQKKQDPAK